LEMTFKALHGVAKIYAKATESRMALGFTKV
jgi:hypothetical protein